jgi:Raf kinase inhibitor-like YbhB/YbcL family protein
MRSFLIFSIFCLIIITGCSSQQSVIKPDVVSDNKTITINETNPMPNKLLQMQIPAYENKGQMPAKFATKNGGGENLSPEIRWQILPAAQSYALLFDDRFPAARNWVHWLVSDIPNTVTEISEGASRTNMPAGSKELQTSWGRTGYDGPQPPVGSGQHEYVMTLYALDIPKLGLIENVTRAEFLKAIETHVIAEESWSGYFAR